MNNQSPTHLNYLNKAGYEYSTRTGERITDAVIEKARKRATATLRSKIYAGMRERQNVRE